MFSDLDCIITYDLGITATVLLTVI